MHPGPWPRVSSWPGREVVHPSRARRVHVRADNHGGALASRHGSSSGRSTWWKCTISGSEASASPIRAAAGVSVWKSPGERYSSTPGICSSDSTRAHSTRTCTPWRARIPALACTCVETPPSLVHRRVTSSTDRGDTCTSPGPALEAAVSRSICRATIAPSALRATVTVLVSHRDCYSRRAMASATHSSERGAGARSERAIVLGAPRSGTNVLDGCARCAASARVCQRQFASRGHRPSSRTARSARARARWARAKLSRSFVRLPDDRRLQLPGRGSGEVVGARPPRSGSGTLPTGCVRSACSSTRSRSWLSRPSWPIARCRTLVSSTSFEMAATSPIRWCAHTVC